MLEVESYLNKNFFLSSSAANELSNIISIVEIEKNTRFVQEAKSNDKEYLVFDGLCQSFVINPKGQEVTLSFFTANTAISPNLTRCISNKSIVNIQTLMDSKIAVFSSQDLMRLMAEHREIEVWANHILQKELIQKVRKEINQNSLSAKNRIIEFRAIYPSLENQIPHPIIASYLGITNVSLSRLRRELSRT